VEYPLTRFPAWPWARAGRGQDRSLAQDFADWLNATEPQRLAVVQRVLSQAGAPIGGLAGGVSPPDAPPPGGAQPGVQPAARPSASPFPDGPPPGGARLGELGAWVQEWFPVLAVPLIEQGFLRDYSAYRLGRASAAWDPAGDGYSRHGDALLGTVTYDLAFIVAAWARAARPGLIWQPVFDLDGQQFFVTLDPGRPVFDLVAPIADLLVQSAARPRGARSRLLRQWYGQTLRRCYERAVAGTPIPGVLVAFPDADGNRADPRRWVTRPLRSDLAAPQALIEAAAAFQQAGWFDTVALGAADLARAAQAAWRMFGEEFPVGPAETNLRLLLLDQGRTWSEDPDAGVQPRDGVYEDTVEAVGRIAGKQLGNLWDAEEDWAGRPGDLLLSVQTKRGPQRLLIPSPGPYLSAALFTGLNDSLPAGGPRFWFLDHGRPLAVVTRATAAERDALQRLTGLRLGAQPPDWWAGLAPLRGAPETGPTPV